MLKTTLTAALALAAGHAFAGPIAAQSIETKEQSVFDRLWDLPVLYKNKNNPVLQEFSLQGRLQLQWGTGTSDQGSYGSEDRPEEVLWGDAIEVRRWRLGFKSVWFHQFKLEGQIDISPNFDPEFYGQIYDLYLTWAPNDAFNLSAGKFKANFFGLEQSTSSKEILTIERGLLANALFPGELTGVRANGKKNGFVYGAAIYAGDQVREFTEDTAGTVVQAHVGYDLKKQVGLDKALIRLDYQNSSDAANSGGGARFEHAFSLNAQLAKNQWLLSSEVLAATGQAGTGDVWGINVIPAYNITKQLQVVGRYQYAHGENDGLRLQNRYERLAPELTNGGRGDDYHAAYLGLNYYIYGHKMKLMAGTEYHHMDGGGNGGDFDGFTTTVAFRMFF